MDKEFFLLFTVMDENLSWYLKNNIQTYGTNESDPENEGFQESNMMHGNLHTFTFSYNFMSYELNYFI